MSQYQHGVRIAREGSDVNIRTTVAPVPLAPTGGER